MVKDRYAVRKTIGEILDEVADMEIDSEKAQHLRMYDSPSLRTFLKYALDPTIEFMLPPGQTDIKIRGRNKPGSSSSELFNEMKRMYVFLAPHPTEKYNKSFAVDTKRMNMQREMKWVNMLEAFYPEEVEYAIQMKDKTLSAVDIPTVNLAFPGLIPIGKSTPKPKVQKVAEQTDEIYPLAENGLPERTVIVNNIPVQLTVTQWVEYQKQKQVKTPPEVKPQKVSTKKETPPAPKEDDTGGFKMWEKVAEYNNLGKCKTCGKIQTILFQTEKGMVVECQGCGVISKPKPTKREAIEAWRAVKKKASPKGKARSITQSLPDQEKGKEGHSVAQESLIIQPTPQEVAEISQPVHQPRVEHSLLEDRDDLNGDVSGEPAPPAFQVDENTGDILSPSANRLEDMEG